ncbi:hypothetical protein FSST1_009713 [Fusarium sambucinum]
MLCELCSDLDLNALMRLRLEPYFTPSWWGEIGLGAFEESKTLYQFSVDTRYRADYKIEDLVIPYHKDMEDLYRASEGCDLCRALLQSARSMIKFLEEAVGNTSLWVHSPSGEGLFLCGLRKGQGIQLMASDNQNGSPHYSLLGAVGFYVDQDSPLIQTIHGRTIPKSPISKDNLSSISRWLSNCSTHHQHSVNNIIKPTRLLRYEHEKGKVSLCTSIISDIHYVALSHCWGSAQPLTLNNDTKNQLEEGLPLEAFPKTFKDAFSLIHQLGIPYIWIDSLCILQDDNDDWVRESARMCDVYGNAYLTIAASRAENCSEGFLGPREGPEYRYIPFYRDGMHDNIAICPMSVRRISHLINIMDLDGEPLSKRAWALQERYLSPRTVHFANDQMYFECRSGFHPQDNHMEIGDSEPDFKIHRKATAKDNDKLEDAWGPIVSRYTQRYITVESDKLPAIGGLAAHLLLEQALNGDPAEEYLAGLWRRNLLWDLVWMVDWKHPERSTPKHYTAPSWSWASVDHPIVFLGPQDLQSLAVMKDAKVDLKNLENPFGQVTGGWVQLSCIKLHPCDPPCDAVDNEVLYFGDADALFGVRVTLDPSRFNLPSLSLEDYMDKKFDLVAVPLTLYIDDLDLEEVDEDQVCAAFFLILVSSTSLADPSNDPPRYRRVGLGRSYERDTDPTNAEHARRQMRDRCLAAMEQGTLEDIIIV